MSIWNLLPHPYADSVVRTYWRMPNGKRGGDYARTEKELDRFADVIRMSGRNGYIAPNPTASTIGDRHNSADVTHWSYMFIDVDPVEDIYDPLKTLDEALLWLGEWVGRDFAKHKPMIIDSGRGAQAWIRLEDVILDDRQMDKAVIAASIHWQTGEPLAKPFALCTRKSARRAMGHWLRRLDERIGLMNGCKIDTSTSDLPRLMRCPGTINSKTGREARIIEQGDGPNMGLASLLVSGTPDSVFAEPAWSGEAGRTWQDALGDLTMRAQTYLTQGHEEPGRHVTMWLAAKSMSEKGVLRDQARLGLRYADQLRGEEQELGPEEIETVLDAVYGLDSAR